MNYRKRRLKENVMQKIKNLRYSKSNRRKIEYMINKFINGEYDYIIGEDFLIMNNSPKSNIKRFISKSLKKPFELKINQQPSEYGC